MHTLASIEFKCLLIKSETLAGLWDFRLIAEHTQVMYLLRSTFVLPLRNVRPFRLSKDQEGTKSE